ncbi:MAG TPA: FAD-linked oxidase C-terminal domain-containing protein, partial [Thermomicrobiales bacterium]
AIEGAFGHRGVEYIGHFSHWFPWGASLYDRFLLKDPPADPNDATALHDEIWNVAVRTSIAHGGMINEHHGVGLKLSRFMREQYGPAWSLLEDLKRALDPNGIMNPGKKLPFAPDSGPGA